MSMRKGTNWVQPFMIFFFLLILILSIALLSLDQGKLQSERGEFSIDMADQETNAQLINILRIEATGEFEGGGAARLADLIIINNGTYDAMIMNTLQERMPPNYYYELLMSYPDGKTYTVSNTNYDAEFKQTLREEGPAAIAEELEQAALRPNARVNLGAVPESLATTFLPGAARQNIKVELFFSQKHDATVAEIRGERT